jgi:DNA-directed RNA polymerase specialized sigma24 family protein
MTPEQFAALAELLRLRSGPARECARLVLVEGRKTPEAAEAVGMQYRAAAAAVQRARSGLELAKTAAGLASI